MSAYVYIQSNKHRSTFYIGSTTDLRRRLMEHRRGKGHGFTARYNLGHLLYYEVLPSIHEAKARVKQLKNWHREWKNNLIKQKNTEIRDLSADIPGLVSGTERPKVSDAETSSASPKRKQIHAN